MRKHYKILKIVILMTSVLFLFGCRDDNHFLIEKRDYFALDTVNTVIVEYDDRVFSKEQVKADLIEVEDILLDIEINFSISQTVLMAMEGITESTLMKVNNNSGKKDNEGNKVLTTINDDFIELVKMATIVSIQTNGGFDATIGPLTTLWNISGLSNSCRPGLDYDEEKCVIPTSEEIEQKKALIDYRKLELDEENHTLYLTEPKMMLDFGAIAKGFAADKVLEYLIQKNYHLILVNLGGNVYNYGESKKTEGDVLTHIRNPFPENPYLLDYLLSIYTKNQTIVTSGISERYIEVEEKIYHHLLNPLTGYPFDNEIETVTIICSYQEGFYASAYADAIATGIYALGLDMGLKFINNHDNLKAVFITKDKRIYITEGLNYELGNGFNDDFRLFVGNKEIKK